MALSIICHGGCCCGIKTIYGFDYYSSASMEPAISAEAAAHPSNPGVFQNDHSYPGKNFFKGPAPRETSVERLDRYLAYVDKYRPKHLVEVVLASGQLVTWRKLIEARGFEEKTKFANSNSGNTVYVFHRVTPLKKKEKASA